VIALPAAVHLAGLLDPLGLVVEAAKRERRPCVVLAVGRVVHGVSALIADARVGAQREDRVLRDRERELSETERLLLRVGRVALARSPSPRRVLDVVRDPEAAH
jgi:hypothetical protein